MKQHSNNILVDFDAVKVVTLVLEKNTPLGPAESAAAHKKVSSNDVICGEWGKVKP